jgi:hypothetical protein
MIMKPVLEVNVRNAGSSNECLYTNIGRLHFFATNFLFVNNSAQSVKDELQLVYQRYEGKLFRFYVF